MLHFHNPRFRRERFEVYYSCSCGVEVFVETGWDLDQLQEAWSRALVCRNFKPQSAPEKP